MKRRRPVPISAWAEKHRVLEMSAIRGRWRNVFTPYLTGIMDVSGLPGVETVIICKSPQTGGSECGHNIVGYCIDRLPGPVMYVFPDELTAFRTYAKLYPSACILLVDTYDTLGSGVPNAIQVFKEMREAGIPLNFYGIRLDSGDLAYMSKEARKMLDAAGFEDAVIAASSDLDEYLIDSLKSQGAKITSWGVGTNLITSKDCPAFGGVYKLAAVKTGEGDFVPKIKLSENTEKITNPGNKTVYRIYEKENGKLKADLICLVDDQLDESKDLTIFDPLETWKKTHLKGGTYTLRELMIPVFKNGECVYTSPSVMDIRKYCMEEQNTLWDETRRLVNPHEVYVDLSDRLYRMKTDLLNQMHPGD